MSDVDVITLGLDRHDIKCPHCQKQTTHDWPGTTILFATAKCMHCGNKFLIALNDPSQACKQNPRLQLSLTPCGNSVTPVVVLHNQASMETGDSVATCPPPKESGICKLA
jgi:DNA-directed RNA polymerase subunit RPC12/RpoP